MLESPTGRLQPEAFLRESIVDSEAVLSEEQLTKTVRNSLSTLDSVFFQQISQKKCRLCPEAETAEEACLGWGFQFQRISENYWKNFYKSILALRKFFQLLGSKLSFTRVKVSLRTTTWGLLRFTNDYLALMEEKLLEKITSQFWHLEKFFNC